MTQETHGEAGRLPNEVTSFIGRRQATAEIKRALSGARLVTLTGPGGVGKSRLALHVAHDLRRVYRDGIWLVEFAKVEDPALVPQAVTVALDVRDQSMRDTETVLAEYLADKHLLLILDNCEHVLDASGPLTTVLLSAAPNLHVLATSREPLRALGEHVWPVPPLSIPANGANGDGSARRHEALRLFEDRAASAVPGFALTRENEAEVARLCQRLDGIPLAIELAAVRLRVLSADQILTRLEDRFRLLTTGSRSAPLRHQTLRAAVDWSFDLCAEQERTLWARCSVFAGEFPLAAAESVCAGEGLAASEVFTAVAGLVEKSVLIKTETGHLAGYRMLETIRQYGRERLAEHDEEDALRHRHRDYYLRLAEQSDVDSGGPHQADLARRLRADRADFVAALGYCATTPGEARTGLRLAAALWFFWIACGFVRDGRHWLDRLLAADPEPSSERARALWIDGWIAHLQGDEGASLALLGECRDLARRLGDETTLTYALQFLGDTAMWAGDPQQAERLLEEALTRHRASGQWTAPALLIFALWSQTRGLLGDTEQAIAQLDECRTLCTPLGERWALSWARWNVSVTLWAAGEPAKAYEHLQESLRDKEELNDPLGIACCVELLSWVAGASGDPRRAAVLFGGAERMWGSIGRPLFGSGTLLTWSRESEARCREALGRPSFEAARQDGAQRAQDKLIAYALGEKPAEQTRAATTAAPVLTKREREVAALVGKGLSNKEIAAKLVISQRTAETHVEHILSKLGFTSRAQIAAWLYRDATKRA